MTWSDSSWRFACGDVLLLRRFLTWFLEIFLHCTCWKHCQSFTNFRSGLLEGGGVGADQLSGTSFGSFGENCTETDLWCKTEVQMSKYLLNKLAWQCPQWLVIWDQGVADGGHSSAWSNKPTMPSATWIQSSVLHFYNAVLSLFWLLGIISLS